MKYYIVLGFFAVVAAYPGIIHQEAPQAVENYDHQGLIGESGHHHQVQHEHAKSHQSIKFEHFHPVPVYVKKEHAHLIKHPLEQGQSEQNLKQIHPEAQHSHGGGLVLEDHRLNTDHLIASLGHEGFEHAGLEHGSSEQGGLEHAGLQQGGYENYGGSYEGGEGLKGYAEAQPEIQGHYYSGYSQGESGEGYKAEHY